VYPVSSFTWILLYERIGDRRRSQQMVQFMRWALKEGQRLTPSLGYAPLPAEIVKLDTALLDRVR
jgi:phosphate transport system substrate-binding protein